MAMDDAVRSSILTYCQLEEEDLTNEEKVLLEEFYDDAVSYMADSGVTEPAAGTKRAAKYNLCVKAMVLDSWDRRSAQTESASIRENPAFRRRLNQLKRTEPVPKSGTGSGE